MESLRGHLLIAPAHLTEPNFLRTVVLLIQHDEDGAFGVVLNRSTNQTIQDLWRELRRDACRSRQRMNAGGPVPGPLVALHRDALLGEAEVLPGVFCTMSAERLEALVDADPEPLRIYAGYSGWGRGQLEGELQIGSWLTTEARRADIFFDSDDETLWRGAFRRAAGARDPWPEVLPDEPPTRDATSN